jgi:hypothetical protein
MLSIGYLSILMKRNHLLLRNIPLGKANLTSLSSHAMLQAIIEDTRAGLEEQYAKTEAISKAATRRSTLGREEKYFEPEPHRKPC